MLISFETAAVAATLVHFVSAGQALPVVDLGYELQQATCFDSTGQTYNFSNIRYAAPPVGNLRFRAPQPPVINRTKVQTGSPDRICPQATPTWQSASEQFVAEYTAGKTHFTPSDFNLSSPAPTDPRTTEDCLFLDIVVPKEIFDYAGKGNGAPVLVWIYGGGYVGGSKSEEGSPAGLISRSQTHGDPGVIYVTMNYRLGAFGWLSGPTLQADGVANAGLYDQRFALEWVQSHIAKFGGDPSRVTVFGESAGGGSILHQITAYGGSQGPVPFQQAILQSPAFFPVVSNQQQEDILSDYLSLLNVQTIDQARQLPFSKLLEANTRQVTNAVWGQFVYGPAVDGDFVPQLPGLLLLHDQYDKNLTIMLGHNADEGLILTSPFVQNNTDFQNQVTSLFPTARAYPSVIEYITNTLYPPKFDGSQGYTNQIARAAMFVSEELITCNTFFLDKAFGNKTQSYLFSVPPALHGSDIEYTYYNGHNQSHFDPEIAIILQEYITRFAETGSPNEQGVPFFPIYGTNSTVQNLNVTGVTQMMDPAANYRCDWWQKALYQ